MSMKDFEAFVRKSIAREAACKEHEMHPDIDVFLAAMALDISEEQPGALVAHVATCRSCQAKWRAVERAVGVLQERVEARLEVPSLAQLVRERKSTKCATGSWFQRLSRGPKFRLGPVLRPALVPVLTSVAVLAIVLGVTAPTLRGGDPETSSHLAALTNEVEALRRDTRTLTIALAQVGATIQVNILRPEVPADARLSVKEEAEFIAGPRQRALHIASFLSRWGIEPSSQVNWKRFESYTVRSGETCQSLAGSRLGDPPLWPLLWLLNSHVGRPDKDLLIGAQVFLPALLRSFQSTIRAVPPSALPRVDLFSPTC